jgi:hypothetical protein
VRVDLDTARALRDAVVRLWEATRGECETDSSEISCTWSKASWRAARKYFADWIKQQEPRWKAEADACIKNHGLRVFGDTWPPLAATEVA